MSSIALILCGKSPVHIQAVVDGVAPAYDVIHVCTSETTATKEIPDLLRNKSITPSSGFGTNTKSDNPRTGDAVKAIVLGGGFGDADFHQIKHAVEGVRPEVTYFRADTSKTQGGGPPRPDELTRRLMEGLEEAREGDGFKAGLFWY